MDEMYLLAFVNRVRAAQSRAPIEDLPVASLGALELAMRCRLDGGTMRFTDEEAASDVAAEADLALGPERGTVELPHAINRYLRILAADPDSPSRSIASFAEPAW